MVRRQVLSSCWGCGWSGRSSTWRRTAFSGWWCPAGGRRMPTRSRSWSSATSWQSCAATTHAPGSSPKTARSLRRSAASSPGRDGRPSWSRRDAAWMAPAHGAPALELPSAGRGRPSVPQQVQTLIVRLAAENHAGRPAHPRGAAAPWLPGFRKLHRQGPARGRSPAGAATSLHHVAVMPAPAGSRDRGP